MQDTEGDSLFHALYDLMVLLLVLLMSRVALPSPLLGALRPVPVGVGVLLDRFVFKSHIGRKIPRNMAEYSYA